MSKNNPNEREIAFKAIELLEQHGLSPKPLNYAVAFEHISGAQPELSSFLHPHLQAGKPLDEILLQDLYDKHIASDQHKQFQGMRNDMQGLLQTLLMTISESQDHTAEYQRELETGVKQLGDKPDQEALARIATNMISATVTTHKNTQKLQDHLATARQEADQLRAELEAQRREAMIDPLTGLFNRRAMAEHLEQLWENPDNTLSVLMLDIDHFKRVNDTYGHAIGDIVIRNVADNLRKSVRGEDVVVRYGGEEFLVLLPNTPLKDAVTVAESIRKRIEALRLVRKSDNFSLDPFTISLGVAQRRAGDEHDSLIERADKALYSAKTSGRNRVMHESGTDAPTLH